jgi:hypothetical protein
MKISYLLQMDILNPLDYTTDFIAELEKWMSSGKPDGKIASGKPSTGGHRECVTTQDSNSSVMKPSVGKRWPSRLGFDL